MSEPKIVLITGCSSGIGMATAVSLAKDTDKNYIVYATMRNLAKSKPLEEGAGSALNDKLFIRAIDVTKEETIDPVVDEIKEKHGRVDILMNNAGGGGLTVFDCAPVKEIFDVMDMNFFGCVRMIQRVLPMMKARESGRIINISSLYGLFGMPHAQAYCASKSAIEGMSESLAIELRQFGIWVSTVSPGPVKTALLSNMFFNEHLYDSESLDAKTRTSYQAVCNMTKYLLDVPAHPVAETVDAVRRAMEDAKPHLRYRSARSFEFESLKFTDEHGDDYVEAGIKALDQALNS